MSPHKLLRLVKCLVILMPLCSNTLQAEIAQQPLYLQSKVQPNIFFLVDDSGSMEYEVLKSNGANDISAYNSFNGNYIEWPYESRYGWWPNYKYYWDDESVLKSCSGFNVLFYDPNVTYDPWAGKDKYGNAYQNQNIKAARSNPYDPYDGTVDLTASFAGRNQHHGYPGYFKWTDDGDGIFERYECPDPNSNSFDYQSQFVSTTGSAGAKIMTDSEKTNFANWYTYYRKREYVAKAALLGIVNGATERMGLATLHRNNSVGYPVADMTDSSKKDALLEQIANIYSRYGTPLRTKLRDVGKYFANQKPSGLFSNSENTPILSKSEGGACQQNFAILMSDGYWNGDNSPSVGNTDKDSNNGFDGGSYADSYSDTLADVAMHYYETDLSSLPNEVPTSAADNNDQQHLVTYTVAFGVNGTLSSNPANTTSAFAWPRPVSDTSTTIDDLRHAAWNGRGDFLSASSPTDLIAALNSAIKSIDKRASSSSAVAANSTKLDTDTQIFQARFSTGSWTGDLWAYDLDDTSGSVGPLAWRAADLMPAETNRKIYTSTDKQSAGVEFEWSNLTAAQKTAINSQEVDYIRGDQSNEGIQYRSRISTLGDIINSDPIYSGKENFAYYSLEMSGTSSTYYAYLTGTTKDWQKGSRTPALYVGANDGMLHAFNKDGEELFGYIPKTLISALPALTKKTYEHRYYVDGTPSYGDAYIDYDGIGKRWGTALVGVLGGGGKGIFALDISDPTNFDEDDVLWDLDDSYLPDLGYTFSQPSIVKLANGAWGAVFGNGYNSANHEAVLYIVNLETGLLIKEIHTKAFGTSASSNGLSTPIVVDTDGDKIADGVYAGDLKGNMWAFDISASNINSWGVKYSQGNTPKPLFIACTDTQCTDRQPITSQPQSTRTDSGSVMVLFGTGKYFEKSDATDISQVQSYYGVQDKGATVASRDKLKAQKILVEFTAAEKGLSSNTRVTSNFPVDLSAKDGWYLDFGSSKYPGERIVSGSLIRNGRVIFSTLVPDTDPCSSGGTSWLMELDADTGARLTISPFDVNGDGIVDDNDLIGIDTDGDGKDDTLVAASGQESLVGITKTPGVISTGKDEKKYTSGSSGNIGVITESGGDSLGRQSWKQLK